jgi:hypothetical protein
LRKSAEPEEKCTVESNPTVREKVEDGTETAAFREGLIVSTPLPVMIMT